MGCGVLTHLFHQDIGQLEEKIGLYRTARAQAGHLESDGRVAVTLHTFVADTIDEFGAIDCLVNSAGILPRGNAEETSDDDWRNTMTINLDVPFYLSRSALPSLLKSEGSIINISAYWGLRAGPRALAYCVSKGGLIQFTRAMALDYAAHGLRVNAICPGGVDTPMLAEGAVAQDVDVDSFLADIAEFSPNKRIAEPSDIASLVLFLAGDSAKHITGTAIPIDGGLWA
jgi:NAD(P)-dependent dehydrogenase (short-subunit alcohol dehydrogenase family)